MPLIRRLPKRGFNSAAFRKQYAIVNLNDLNGFKPGTVITEQLLRDSKLVRGHFAGIKILGDGELKHDVKVEADKVSAGAREKIEKAGGTITLRDKKTLAAKRAHAVAMTDISAAEPVDEPASGAAEKKKSSRKTTAKAKSRTKKKRSRES
jgi:ribosomal protein L18E